MSRVVTPRAPPEGYTPVQISDYEKATRTLTAISRKRIEANDLIRSNLSGQSTAKSAYAAEMVKNRNIKRNLYPLYILAEYDKNWNEYNTGAQKNLSAYESNIKNLQGAIAGYNTSEKEINAWINNYNNYLKAVEGQRQELGRFYASQTPESVSTKTITGVSGAPRLPTAEQHRAWEDPKDIKVSGTKILTPTETEAMLSQAGLTIPDLKERVAQTGEITSLTPKELEQWKKDVKEGVVRGVGEASQLRHEAIVQRELLQSRIDKLVSSGLLEIGKAKETGDIVYNTTKPVKMMSTEEIAQLNAVGFKIDYPEERSVSEGLYAWVQGQERKLETGEWEVPSEWKDEVKKGLREVALSTAAIGKFESELFGIPKAIALKMKGQQPFEYMTTVNMDTITKAEKLTDQERGQLALKVGIANLAADYVRGKPIGYLFKVVTPVIGGLARGLTTKAGRFASAVSSSSIGQKVPTEIVQTAALIKNIGMKVPWYAARVITKHPRALEIAAWTVGLGNEANKALLDIEKGESLARVAQNAFINIAGMVGTDIGIRSGYNYDIPIKYGKVEWPLWGGGKAKWNGFYTQYGDDVARLTGTVSVYDDAGKLISSSDEIVAQGGIRGGSKGFTPETKIQTQITWDALEKLGYHGDQIALLQDIDDTVRYTRGLRSAYIDDVLPGKIGALTDDGGRILKEYLMDNGDLIEQVKGSYATRAQLNEAYGFRLRGQNSLRAPNDIDLMVFGTQDDAIQFADELYSKLQGTGNTLRIDPNNPTKIQSYIDGKWKHCVEVFPHGAPGLGDTPTGMRWGHKLDTGSITIEGLPALSLGDQTVRKGTNVMGFTEGFEIGPDAWRLKDIVDFEHAARTLLDSEEVLNRAIFAKLQRVQEYYGVINVADCLDIRDEFTKIIYEATGGGQNAVNALSASGLDIYTYMYGLGLQDYIPVLGLPTLSKASYETGYSQNDLRNLLKNGYSMNDIYDVAGKTYTYTPVTGIDNSYLSASPHLPDTYTFLSVLGEYKVPPLPSYDDIAPLPDVPGLSPPSYPYDGDDFDKDLPIPSPPPVPESPEPPVLPSIPDYDDGDTIPIPPIPPIPKPLKGDKYPHEREPRDREGYGRGKDKIEVRRCDPKDRKEDKDTKKVESYRVVFDYETGASETKWVSAKNFFHAYNLGNQSRNIKLIPRNVLVEHRPGSTGRETIIEKRG